MKLEAIQSTRHIRRTQKIIVAIMVSLAYLAASASAHEGEDHDFADFVDSGTWSRSTGTVVVNQADDFKNKRARFIYELSDQRGKRKILFFERMQNFKTGDKLKIRAYKRRVKGKDDLYVPANSNQNVTVLSSGAEIAAVTGARSMLLMRVTMNDGVAACSPTAISNLMWNDAQNIDGLYRESSYNALWFTPDTNNNGAPDVIDVSINYIASGLCNYDAWASAADSAATVQGYNLSLYNHRGYILPPNIGCTWAGLGALGGSNARFWIKGAYCSYADVYAHEIGHNISMHHAAVPGGSEYDDRSCIMGYGGVGYRHFNAPHKDQMGWLPSYEVQSLATTQSGQYTLSALEASLANDAIPKLLKFAKPNTGQTYYVSYRRRLGNYSSGLGDSYNFKTSIHYYSSGPSITYLQSLNADGALYTDSANQISVRQISHNDSNSTATVEVLFGSDVLAPTRPLGLRVVSGGGG